MPAPTGKYRWKGEQICTKQIHGMAQVELNEAKTWDLWLVEKEKRVYVTMRDWTQEPEPPEAKDGELYCGEITRRDVRVGELELMVLNALDRKENPWRYARTQILWVCPDPKPWETERLYNVPIFHTIAHKDYREISKHINNMMYTDAKVAVYVASTKALVEFHKRPDKKEIVVQVSGWYFIVRGHGYFGDLPAVSDKHRVEQA